MDTQKIISLKQELVTLEGQQKDLSQIAQKKKSNASTANISMIISVICLLIGVVINPLLVIFPILLVLSIFMYVAAAGRTKIESDLSAVNQKIENNKKEIIQIEYS